MVTNQLLLGAAPHAPAAPILPTPGRMDTIVKLALDGHPRLLERLLDGLGQVATNLLVALLIVALTVWASGWIAGLVRRALGRIGRHHVGDTLLQSFISSFVRWAILIVGLVAVLQQLGVQTTSILAMLGAASLAIGLALQGALSNVAASVMILILRPYRVGDFVEINGKMGTVQGLDLFATKLSDPDNLDLFMPNSKVFGEMIINYSSPSNRRMELNFRIDYDDDLDVALAAMMDCIKADKRIQAKPEPWTGVTALTDSWVTVTLRAWAPVNVYWDVRYAMLRRVKDQLKAVGMSVPYPRQISVDTERKPVRKAKAGPAPGPKSEPGRGRQKTSGNQPPSQGGT
ncbi:MAG TPA: mechanosensitive ion channel family protein [Caulobacteraceae bacterium]|jgi:small conductance mechanosensitive channel